MKLQFLAIALALIFGFVSRGIVDFYLGSGGGLASGAPPHAHAKPDDVVKGREPEAKAKAASADGVAEPRRALLMTAVWGTTRPWLLAASARLFVESALDIVVIGDAELVRDAPNEPTAAQLRVEFVDALRVRRTKAWDEFAVQRFEHFASTLRRLRAEGRNYTHVMVCDAGDVLFQADPFARVPPNSIVFSLEAGIKVSEQPHNAGWVRNLLADGGNGSLPRGPTAGRPYDGCALLDEIGDEIVSCSGATLGAVDAMETYLDDMAQIINALPVRLDLGMDQGVHNVVVHHLWRNDSRRRLMGYLESPVYTAGFVRGGDFEIDVLGRLRHPRGIPAVHHQLNRHFRSWLEVANHWHRRLGAVDPDSATRDRYAEEVEFAAKDEPLASVGRADPRHFVVEEAVANWPTERFRAINDSWCGDSAAFTHACAERTLPLAKWRVSPEPNVDFRCNRQ